jgi:hypothetical protein
MNPKAGGKGAHAAGAEEAEGDLPETQGSGIWWICYAGNDGQIHREEVGMRQAATHTYQLRKTQVQLGKFLPEHATETGVI